MKVKSILRSSKEDSSLAPIFPGWLDARFGEHYAQISVDTTLKLKSACKDVSRAMRKQCSSCSMVYQTTAPVKTCSCGNTRVVGYVSPDIEELTKSFKMPPQTVNDFDFVMGYAADEGWVPGSSIEGHAGSDEALLTYIERYPEDWEIVKKSLGLARQKGRHACLPAGEGVMVVDGNRTPVPIEKCGGLSVYTGQEKSKKTGYSPYGDATLLHQGVREVWEFTTSTGKKLRCTPDHLILTSEGWMQAQKALETGADVIKSNTRVRLEEEDAIAYASVRGGKLVSWGGKPSKISSWSCCNGHSWSAEFTRMHSYEHWCKKCSNQYRFQTRKSVAPERQASKQLANYRRADSKRGRETSVDIDIIINARKSPCSYCSRLSTGMERIDNSQGHTKENCVPACLRCNWMRGRYISHETMLQVGKLLQRIDP